MKPLTISLLGLAALALVGCDQIPGRPKLSDRRPEPSQISNFETLYHQNCRGCHGAEGAGAPVLPLNNPLYLSLLPREQLRNIIAAGIPGKAMPGFAESEGGSLTDAQIDILTNGIAAWAKGATAPAGAPAYSAPLGDAGRGAGTFAIYCASCHGADGRGLDGKASSVVDPAYLGLVSDQYLRTITIVGRPDLGCPDFQHRVPGRAMTNEEVGDVVAWLASQRKNEFGQPLTTAPQPQ